MNMYSSARDVAESALRLLEVDSSRGDLGDRELAAAMLAVHVCDWYYIRDLGMPDTTPSDKEAFARLYPDWADLLEIVNGTKHPKKSKLNVSAARARTVEWEDLDFWYAPQRTETLFINVDRSDRSIHALVYAFCTQFLKQA